MSWKCETCDTYNDDSLDECYVCGTRRHIKTPVALRGGHKKAEGKHRRDDEKSGVKGAELLDWQKLKYLVMAIIGIPTIVQAYALITIIIHNDFSVLLWNIEEIVFIVRSHFESACSNIVLLFQVYSPFL